MPGMLEGDFIIENRDLDIVRVTVTADGAEVNGDQELSSAPSISADETRVAFHSDRLNRWADRQSTRPPSIVRLALIMKPDSALAR